MRLCVPLLHPLGRSPVRWRLLGQDLLHPQIQPDPILCLAILVTIGVCSPQPTRQLTTVAPSMVRVSTVHGTCRLAPFPRPGRPITIDSVPYRSLPPSPPDRRTGTCNRRIRVCGGGSPGNRQCRNAGAQPGIARPWVVSAALRSLPHHPSGSLVMRTGPLLLLLSVAASLGPAGLASPTRCVTSPGCSSSHAFKQAAHWATGASYCLPQARAGLRAEGRACHTRGRGRGGVEGRQHHRCCTLLVPAATLVPATRTGSAHPQRSPNSLKVMVAPPQLSATAHMIAAPLSLWQGPPPGAAPALRGAGARPLGCRHAGTVVLAARA